MKEVFDVSVILPIKSALSVGFIDYFEKSIESLKTQKLSINELFIIYIMQNSFKNSFKNYG